MDMDCNRRRDGAQATNPAPVTAKPAWSCVVMIQPNFEEALRQLYRLAVPEWVQLI